MKGSQSRGGLRRFVRTGPNDAPPDPPGAPGPPGPPGQAAPQTSAQAAATSLPPLVAELLDAAPAPKAEPARAAGQSAQRERCELCKADVPDVHGHVADLESSTLVCACRACYLLFTSEAAGRGRYRAVPDRYLRDSERSLTAAQWDQLEIPVGLAFFLASSRANRVTGFYPSPAGATECILDLAAWQQLTSEHPLLGAPEPDVEAALICRTDTGVEYYLVPIDACYELAGRMRLHWRGFDGGTEARASIADFLDGVRSRAREWGAAG
jgi:Family of unknown function (DUF5947)